MSMVLPTLAAAAQDGSALQASKDLINALSVPQFSLPVLAIAFVLMLVTYRTWTRPAVFVVLAGIFCLVYFGSMAIDENYLKILRKPDNVPITMMLLGTGFFIWLALRQAAINDERVEKGEPLIEGGRDDKVLVWPDLVYSELICIVLASVALIVWSIVLRAPLEAPANPAGPPNPSKAPWYFLGLQEMLVYYDPWMAGVILPGLIISGLIAMPYMDMNPKGNGYYTLKDRKFAVGIWLFGFLILWVVLIVFGTFLRGPNWNFFGPYEAWNAAIQVPLTNINLSDYFWTFGLGQPLPENMFVREFLGIAFIAAWVMILPVILGFVGLRKMRIELGWIRFVIMSVHLVVMALLPLKMVLRWLFTLKYFIYLPEINLNV
jgi:hypothetical protein